MIKEQENEVIEKDYFHDLQEIKEMIRTNQNKAMVVVNSAMIMTYYEIGTIINKRKTWGSKYIKNLANDLKDVYMNNPSYKATQESNPLIRGMGCALWTDDGVKEYMIDRRLFPRILALAEQMWHNGPLMDFDAFYQRILHKKKWFENRGYGFGPALTEETDNNYKWE